ncbi:MAG: HPF/RaiA family ribosome-associated protein [Reyranella sp.]|uniref:HPF/RaiA family ribosome-associated protein n=1 Tax=Reyranella sp. TaxID=1929291 RepID=UPI0027314264|nr:HPF/RaiA family ribosome-associated protein [Reyranella sp.]MDP1965979.1 HPF/RaiA family ribosome-associated protein [Reyranella sp.]MDP2374353.1 HPF/RaiA family ribosome-associated protein [Reyranella sp.]
MPSWLQITFRNVDASPSLEAKVRERARELERFFNRIVSCRVVIEASKRRRHGDLYHIRVDLKVPGKEIVVKRDPPEHHAHEDTWLPSGIVSMRCGANSRTKSGASVAT